MAGGPNDLSGPAGASVGGLAGLAERKAPISIGGDGFAQLALQCFEVEIGLVRAGLEDRKTSAETLIDQELVDSLRLGGGEVGRENVVILEPSAGETGALERNGHGRSPGRLGGEGPIGHSSLLRR
jgi:hypothetical protein